MLIPIWFLKNKWSRKCFMKVLQKWQKKSKYRLYISSNNKSVSGNSTIVNSWHNHPSITSNGKTNQNFLNSSTKRSTFWGWCHRRWLHICGWYCWTVVSRFACRCWAVVSMSRYCAVFWGCGFGCDCDSHRGNRSGGCGFNATRRSCWHYSRCWCKMMAWSSYPWNGRWSNGSVVFSMHCKNK